jgi:hypothetical protein
MTDACLSAGKLSVSMRVTPVTFAKFSGLDIPPVLF